MKLTKDEARILAEALRIAWYDLNTVDTANLDLDTNLRYLHSRLESFGKDKRRMGRTSRDDYNDLLKRFTKIK